MAPKTATARKRHETIISQHRRREMEWRRTHGDVLLGYVRQWVCLEGEKIVAHGTDVARVVATARRKGVKIPYVFYVEEPRGEGIVYIGL
ncbi:MAG TPA: DUF5678 domain-containing protein [Candidatus Margulisiibacteriota bacterium]|nr:DUF5678 domain-containing protein [Candidatus Margulisiibacteriota bacterium]